MPLAGIAAAIFGISTAQADDLPTRTSAEAPAVGTAPVPSYNWTGCYLGGYAGGVTQTRQVNAWDPSSTGGAFPVGTFYDPPGGAVNNFNIGERNYNLNPGPLGGGTLGCNRQGASPFVFGVEGDVGYLKVSGSAVQPYRFLTGPGMVATDALAYSTKIGDWNATLTGRFGAAWDRLLVYFKGGVGFTSVNSSVMDVCSSCGAKQLTATGSSSRPYWVAGLGVEYAFNNAWSIKGEFLSLGVYRRLEVCGPGAGAAAGSTFCGVQSIEGLRSFTLGVNYHFDTPIFAGN